MTVSFKGIGPLTVGMTVAEARTALGGQLRDPDTTVGDGCGYASLAGAPGSVSAMFIDGVLARVDVRDSGSVRTESGARVGDSEQRIDSIYRGRVKVEPHKYTDGHYLIVSPESPADSAFRLIFETDGKNVVEYRAGRLPEVGFVEGCA
jgi:hypothetical protein